MTTHSNPDVFPDHLHAETLPVPETKREAFELLLILWDHDPNRDASDAKNARPEVDPRRALNRRTPGGTKVTRDTGNF